MQILLIFLIKALTLHSILKSYIYEKNSYVNNVALYLQAHS